MKDRYSFNLRLTDMVDWLLIICIGVTSVYNVKVAGHAVSYYLYFLFVTVAAVAIFKARTLIVNGKLLESAFPFICLMLLSFLWAPSSPVISSNFSSFYICALLIIFAQLIGISSQRFEIAKLIYGLGGVAIAIYMLFANGSEFTHNGRMYLTIGGTSIETNYLNYLFIFPTIYCADRLISKKTVLIEKILLLFSIGFMIFVVLSTGSRGGLTAVTIGGIVTCLFSGKENGRETKKLVITAVVVILVAILFPYIAHLLPEKIIGRFDLSNLVSSGGNGRVDIWKNSLDIILEESNLLQMLFGHGFLSSVSIVGTTLHNVLIEIMFDQGLVGLLLFVVMNIELLYVAFSSRNAQMTGLVVGQFVLSMTLAGVVSRYFWINYLVLILFYEVSFSTEKSDRL